MVILPKVQILTKLSEVNKTVISILYKRKYDDQLSCNQLTVHQIVREAKVFGI